MFVDFRKPYTQCNQHLGIQALGDQASARKEVGVESQMKQSSKLSPYTHIFC